MNDMANQGAADQAFLSERAARFKKERYSKPPSTPKPGPEGEEDAESRHRHIVFSKDPDAQTHSFVRSVCSSVIIRPRPPSGLADPTLSTANDPSFARSNVVVTYKYTIATFLPLFLMDSFNPCVGSPREPRPLSRERARAALLTARVAPPARSPRAARRRRRTCTSCASRRCSA